MLVFDTLDYSEKLQSVGFTKEQAKVQAESLKEILDENIATKRDIFDLKRDIKEMEVKVERDIKEMETRLILPLGTMMVVAVGTVATLVKIL